MNLYLVRHTRTALPPGMCYGRLDVALGPDCDADIKRTLAAIPPVSAVWTSTLGRCLALARPLAARERIKLIADERLVELSFGQWEGKTWDEIGRAQCERWAQDYWNIAPPGGETLAELRERVAAVLREVERGGHPSVAVISHGGPIRAALSVCLGIERGFLMEKTIDFGAVLSLEKSTGAAARWALSP